MRTRPVAPLVLVLLLLLGSPAAAPAGPRAFVTNEKSNDVTVIDLLTAKVVKTIPVGQRPRGVSASPDGTRVYVSNSNSNSLSVIDARALPDIARPVDFMRSPPCYCNRPGARSSVIAPWRRDCLLDPAARQRS